MEDKGDDVVYQWGSGPFMYTSFGSPRHVHIQAETGGTGSVTAFFHSGTELSL